jgi:hypothetical protein
VGIQSDLVVAKADEAPAVAASRQAVPQWQRLSFSGLHNVNLCTLICLVRTGQADRGFDELLGRIQIVASDAAEFADVWLIPGTEVASLAQIAALDDDEFDELHAAWCDTDELAAWDLDEATELLRAIGDLAETAKLRGRVLLLRMGP